MTFPSRTISVCGLTHDHKIFFIFFIKMGLLVIALAATCYTAGSVHAG